MYCDLSIELGSTGSGLGPFQLNEKGCVLQLSRWGAGPGQGQGSMLGLHYTGPACTKAPGVLWVLELDRAQIFRARVELGFGLQTRVGLGL